MLSHVSHKRKQVTMDRRKLDKLVGLKTDIDEILEGSHLCVQACFPHCCFVTV